MKKMEKKEKGGNQILKRRGKNGSVPDKEKQEIDTEKYKEAEEERLKKEDRKSLSSETQIPLFYASLSCLLSGVIVGKGKKQMFFQENFSSGYFDLITGSFMGGPWLRDLVNRFQGYR